MLIKRGANLGVLLLVLFLFVGCAGGGITDPDEMGIHAIADSIKTAIETKNVNMFMSNISLNYSDTEGGTYERKQLRKWLVLMGLIWLSILIFQI
jgi:hypothetical protein